MPRYESPTRRYRRSAVSVQTRCPRPPASGPAAPWPGGQPSTSSLPPSIPALASRHATVSSSWSRPSSPLIRVVRPNSVPSTTIVWFGSPLAWRSASRAIVAWSRIAAWRGVPSKLSLWVSQLCSQTACQDHQRLVQQPLGLEVGEQGAHRLLRHRGLMWGLLEIEARFPAQSSNMRPLRRRCPASYGRTRSPGLGRVRACRRVLESPIRTFASNSHTTFCCALTSLLSDTYVSIWHRHPPNGGLTKNACQGPNPS